MELAAPGAIDEDVSEADSLLCFRGASVWVEDDATGSALLDPEEVEGAVVDEVAVVVASAATSFTGVIVL